MANITDIVSLLEKKLDQKQVVDSLIFAARMLRLYHRHQVIGLDLVPASGRCLIVSNHSLATYDTILLLEAIFSRYGRLTKPLVDRAFFRVPFLGELMKQLGAVQGNPDSAKQLLLADELVVVAPGGMREALRPSSERYQVLWDKRYGFAKLAIETGTPVLLAACPKADDLYDVYENALTKIIYQKFRMPFFLARGIGFTPLPKPVKLTHFLSEPLNPPKPMPDAEKNPEAFKAQVRRFHAKILRRMRSLMAEAIAHRP